MSAKMGIARRTRTGTGTGAGAGATAGAEGAATGAAAAAAAAGAGAGAARSRGMARFVRGGDIGVNVGLPGASRSGGDQVGLPGWSSSLWRDDALLFVEVGVRARAVPSSCRRSKDAEVIEEVWRWWEKADRDAPGLVEEPGWRLVVFGVAGWRGLLAENDILVDVVSVGCECRGWGCRRGVEDI